MLYRISVLTNEEYHNIEFEYIFGKRNLGKYCYEIIHDDEFQIVDITPLVWTWKTFKKCITHTISDTYD